MGAALAFGVLLLCPVALATFPGENGKIAFVREGDIWIMDPDGSNQEQLTSGPADDRTPKWAPDGSAIAFSRHTDGHDRVFIYDLVSGLRRFGDFEKANSPAWSPDARQLVLTRDVPATYDPGLDMRVLAIAPIDGSSARVIPGTGGPVFEPDWSPLGDRIAYEMGDISTWIATIGPGATDRLIVSPAPIDSEIYSASASWSPDAMQIAFTYNCPQLEPGPCTRVTEEQIYAVNADGSNLTQLTTYDALRRDSEPAWSPDGSHIVFTRFDSSPSFSNPTIELMGANGADVEALTDGEQPEWQPLVAPRNTKRPRIVGAPHSGQELTAKPGVWFGTPELTFAYQWRRCASFTPCEDIPGATDPTYVLTGDDLFRTVRLFVTATNDQGNSLAWSLATAVVGRTLVGTDADNHFDGTFGSDLIRGLEGDDLLGGGRGDDFLYGGAGDDRLGGGYDDDFAYGGGGDDRLLGGFGSDHLVGGRGGDQIFGAGDPRFPAASDGRDQVDAGGGPDWIQVRDGHRDVVDCGRGDDVVLADVQDDVHGDCEVVKVA